MPIHLLRIATVAVALCIARPAAAFDTWWHVQATLYGADTTGFSSDARTVLQVENYITDAISATTSKIEQWPTMLGWLDGLKDPGYDYLHFDALWTTAQVTHNWDTLEANTLAALRTYGNDKTMPVPFRKVAELTVLAASLHTVQDFYAHSNWVNYWVGKGKPVPLWFDIDRAARDKLDIHSGAYPDGSSKGHEDHGTLNKDSSERPLNAEAYDAAKRASNAWIERLEKADPSLPWAEMKGYSIADDDILLNFLYAIDVDFVVNSSIVMGHLDGTHTSIFVHVPNEPIRERVAATATLAIAANAYAFTLASRGNKYRLPSPFWSSHIIYHVPRDLAVGMLCADKTYAKPK